MELFAMVQGPKRRKSPKLEDIVSSGRIYKLVSQRTDMAR